MKYIQTFRLHPTPEQAAKIRQRFVLAGEAYNWGLAETERVWEEEHRHLSYFDIKDIYQHHFNYHHYRPVSHEEHEALCHLGHAYDNYFDKRCKKPCRKEPQVMVSYTILARDILYRSSRHHAYLPHIGRVPCNFYRSVQGNPTTATIKEHNGKFNIIFLTELQERQPEDNNPEVVGIDLGLKTFATLSDGSEIPFPEHIWNKRAKRKEARLQRKVKRRKEGSCRYKKAVQKLSCFYEHKANQCKDFHCKTAAKLCCQYKAIAVEHLCVEDMKQGHSNHARNRDFEHYGLTQFLRRLQTRCLRTGTQFIQIGRFEPTTRTCSNCGYLIPHSLSLDVREWICPQCHTQHDRDVNAALNIKTLGQRIQKTLPVADGNVKTAEQTDRSCDETVKAVEVSQSAPSSKEAERHSMARLAHIKRGGQRAVTAAEFLRLVIDIIQPSKISELTGFTVSQIDAIARNDIIRGWRRRMAQERCEALRLALIDGLSQNLPDFMHTPPKAYAKQFGLLLKHWIRIVRMGKAERMLQLPIKAGNRYAWHLYVQTIIKNLETITIKE